MKKVSAVVVDSGAIAMSRGDSHAAIAVERARPLSGTMAPSVILTSDPDDMRQLTRDHPDVTVYPLA